MNDLQQLIDDIDALPGGLHRAGAAAVNRTLTNVKAKAIRLIFEDYNLKAKDIRARLEIIRAKKSDFIAGEVIGLGSAGTPLIKFATGIGRKAPSTKRTKAGGYTPKGGIKVKIKKSGGSRVVHGGFTAQVGQHIGVFKRKDKRQFPIEELFSVSPIGILTTGKYDKKIKSYTEKMLEKNLDHQLSRLLNV